MHADCMLQGFWHYRDDKICLQSDRQTAKVLKAALMVVPTQTDKVKGC